MEPGGFRDALRAQRFLLPELLVAAAILVAGFAGILPFSATPFLVVVGVLSLWLRGQGPRAVGLAFRSDWVRTVSDRVVRPDRRHLLEQDVAGIESWREDVDRDRRLRRTGDDRPVQRGASAHARQRRVVDVHERARSDEVRRQDPIE